MSLNLISLAVALGIAESNMDHASVRKDSDGRIVRGAWQFQKRTWDETQKYAFGTVLLNWNPGANNNSAAIAMACWRIKYLAERFYANTGRIATPQDIAAMWRLGVTGYKRCGWSLDRVPRSVKLSANKVNKLYNEQLIRPTHYH